MKKILKHLGLWDVKRKPRPVANGPPIDVFPTYDEQPGPSADDYIRDPEYPTDVSRRSSKNEDGSLLLKKILSGKTGFLYPKSTISSRF